MARLTSARFGISYVNPATRNEPADVPADIKLLVDAFENNTPMYSHGTIAARPAASKVGRFYFADNEGILYYDNGSAWFPIGPAAPLGISTAQLADLAVTDGKVALASIQGRRINWHRGSAPPGSPVDGDNWLLPISDGGYWHFIYDASEGGANKWKFLGGAPLFSEVAAQQSTGNSSYTALGTAGPSITLPRAGDYDVEIGARIFQDQDNSSSLMSYDIGGTAASDNDAVYYYSGTSREPATNATTASNQSRSRRKTGLGAVTLTAKYRNGTFGNAYFADRWMKVTPVRVA